MKKNITIIIAVVLILVIGLTVFRHKNNSTQVSKKIPKSTVFDLGDGWSRYTSAKLGVSFEYLSNPEIQDWKTNWEKDILVDADPSDIKTIDGWITIMKNHLVPVPQYQNVIYQTVDGLKVAINTVQPEKVEYQTNGRIDVLFVHNNRLANLSTEWSPLSTTTKRIVNSIHVLSKEMTDTVTPLVQHDRGDIANEKIEKISDSWSRYTNTRTKLSFEFPDNLSIEPEGWYSRTGDMSTRITNWNGKDVSKDTVSVVMPINANGIDSVKSWEKFINDDPILGKSVVYKTIGDATVAISVVSPQTGSKYTEVNFFRNNLVNYIIITGLSFKETEHVVNSLNFF